MNQTQRIIDGAKSGSVRLALPEGEDVRTLIAAREIRDSEIADVTLLGAVSAIQSTARDNDVDLTNVSIIDPDSSEYEDEFTHLVLDRPGGRKLSREEAREEVKKPVNFGALMVSSGKLASRMKLSDAVRFSMAMARYRCWLSKIFRWNAPRAPR